MKKLFLLAVLLLSSIFLVGCTSINLEELKNYDFSKLLDFNRVEPADIHVYAPMSLRPVLEELIPIFEDENDGLTVTIDYGTTAGIANSLESSSDTDMVITTSQKQLIDLQNKDLIAVSTEKALATNELVLFSRASSELASIDELTDYAVQRIVIGNPESVPCGQYAQQALTNMGIYESLRYKITEVDSVSDILETVEDSRDSCGIVYKSDVTGNEDFRIVASFPEGSYVPIPYTAVITKNTQILAQTQLLENFLLSDQAKSLLSSYGFDPSSETVQE